jgi:hypothetical protein
MYTNFVFKVAGLLIVSSVSFFIANASLRQDLKVAFAAIYSAQLLVLLQLSYRGVG